VAIDATLRAAAIHQIPRHKKHGDPPGCRRVRVERDDIRNKKMSRRAGTLTVFLVDASGSMALNRMAAAKGAVLRLLSESYTKRDCVSLVSMRGDAAEVLLPPSRSIAMAKTRLATLPPRAWRSPPIRPAAAAVEEKPGSCVSPTAARTLGSLGPNRAPMGGRR
jgi:magnesium chelatase subunit D